MRRRSGIAIFVVVMVCVIISVLVSVVFFQGRDARRKSAEKRDQVQARFLARSAQNHFLLKFRLLPSELYDAVSYAVGKNPYFDFNLKVDRIEGGNSFVPAAGAFTDAGPMFFTGAGTVVNVVGGRFSIQRPAGDAVYSNGGAGFNPSPTNRPRMEYLLNHYVLDVATGHPSYDQDGVVVVSAEPHKDAAQIGRADSAFERPRPGALWADPYSGQYLVRSVKILGSGGTGAASAGRRFEADSVLLTTEASVERDGQVSPVSRTERGLKRLVVQRETSTALDGDSGYMELKEKMESDDEYRRRVLDAKSARRSEIMTAVYLVTRKKSN